MSDVISLPQCDEVVDKSFDQIWKKLVGDLVSHCIT